MNDSEVLPDHSLNDRRKAQVLWHITEGFRLTFLIAISAMAIGYVFMFAVPLMARFSIDAILDIESVQVHTWLQPLVDAVSPEEGASMMTYLLLAGVATLLLQAIAGVFIYVRQRCSAIAAEGIVRRLRDHIFNHLEHLPASFHDRSDTGDLVQRCTSDMETVRVFLSGQTIEIARAVLMLVVVTPILFYMDVTMAWLSLAIMPLLFFAAIWFFQTVKEVFTAVDEAEAKMTTVLQENLTGIRVVRAFARQEFETEKFAEKNAAFRDHNKRLMVLLGGYYGFSDIFCLGQTGFILLVGASRVMDGTLTVGTLFAFITYVSMIIWPIRHMGRVLTDSGKAIVAIGRLTEILTEPVESEEKLTPETQLSGAVSFRDVHFEYDERGAVLNGISFSIAPGETLALLGAPGSGKSTIAQLLLRLYDYQSGSIRLDEHELSTLNRKYVRSQISIVLQEPFLYSASIGANLLVGRQTATLMEAKQAAIDACIHESIERFPRGYESMVGERGVTLSGGQRQRIALARALLKEPPILILDDSLSAVDTDTESQILEALRKRRGKQTTIIIAHRLSSVMHADKILMLQDGRVIQEGTHESLSQTPGTYRQLCQIQGAIQKQIDADISPASEVE